MRKNDRYHDTNDTEMGIGCIIVGALALAGFVSLLSMCGVFR